MTATKPAVLSQKSIDLLRIAQVPVWDPLCFGMEHPERTALLETAASRYSWKAIEVKMNELCARRYVEIIHDWTDATLTPKGRAALEAHTA